MKLQLGSHQLFNPVTGQRILVPKPTSDPNDPLNWNRHYRTIICWIAIVSVFVGNFLCAGPSVAMVELATQFPVNKNGVFDLSASISRMAYAFTTYSLMQGAGNFFWVPLMTKYGRRPVFLISYLLYFAMAIWTPFSKNYGSFMAARILGGFFSGVNETIGPVIIADVCFLHERAFYIALYNLCLNAGVAGGIIISGFITYYKHDWRYIYYIGIALIGSLWLAVLLVVPETFYSRPREPSTETLVQEQFEDKAAVTHKECLDEASESKGSDIIPAKRSYWQDLRLWPEKLYTEESLWTIFIRPIGLICLPPVLWSTLVFTGTISFVVAVSSNYATAFANTYNFNTWQCGLVWVGAIVGSLIATVVGGPIFEWTTDWFTNRNNGIREPEHRIPSIVLSLIACPVGLILYGVGIDKKMHWIVPIVGYGLMSFGVVQGTTVSFVYTIDSYRPIAGEVEVTQLGFKGLFGFLLSFYTNPWISQEGYTLAFGEMAILAGVLIGSGIPLYWYGAKIRRDSLNWRVMKFLQWTEDREMGE